VLCDNKNLYNFPDDFRMTFASITSTYEQFPKPRLCQETWLQYINDIGNAVTNDTIKLFADDTNLFIFGDNVGWHYAIFVRN